MYKRLKTKYIGDVKKVISRNRSEWLTLVVLYSTKFLLTINDNRREKNRVEEKMQR